MLRNLPRRLGRYHAHADALFRGWNDIWLDARFREWNIESHLDCIRCPVLVIQGAEDEYGTAEQVEAIKRQVRAVSALMLDNCRHAPHTDCCDATLRAIREFLFLLSYKSLAAK